MASITFDTLKHVERLKSAGVPDAQATDNTRATQSDIERIERKLIEHDGEFKVIKWMLGIIVGGVVMLVLRILFPA